MLHAQRIPLPEAQATTYIYLSRAASHIIHLYTELNSFGRLDPSWPQLKRIDTCGQILILSCSKGELHPLEAQTLFEKLVKLLEAHVETWPDAADTAHGFVKAVRALGQCTRFKNGIDIDQIRYLPPNGPPFGVIDPARL